MSEQIVKTMMLKQPKCYQCGVKATHVIYLEKSYPEMCGLKGMDLYKKNIHIDMPFSCDKHLPEGQAIWGNYAIETIVPGQEFVTTSIEMFEDEEY